MAEMAADAQSLRDDAAFGFQTSQNRLDRISRMFETALGSEFFLKELPDSAYGSGDNTFWDTLKGIFAEEGDPETTGGGIDSRTYDPRTGTWI